MWLSPSYFTNCLKFFRRVFGTIVTDYHKWYSMSCKSRFDVGGDCGSFGVWQCSYFKESRVVICNYELL